MADERGYDLASEISTYDGDAFLNADKSGFTRAKKYKISILKSHFKVGDQQYTEGNYVTDDETLTVSVDELDMALKALSDSFSLSSGILPIKVELTTSDVATLGTVPFEIMASPGADKSYQLVDIKWAVYPTTTLEAGSQNLIVYFDGIASYLATIRNDQVESATDLIKGVQIQAEHELGVDSKIYCKLASNTDPVSGAATMTFWLIYKVIDV